MASVTAKAVARDVLETIGRGKKPNVMRLALKRGYSPNTAHAGLVQKTKSYQAEIKPYVDSLITLREKMSKEMLAKDLSKERLQTLVQATSTLNHDIQLLSGGKTENVGVEEDRRILLGIVAQLRGQNT